MGFTVTNCADFVRQELGNLPGGPLSIIELVNMAGSHFCGMSKWRFLQRKSTSLDTVAGQTYVVPPADFGGLIALAGSGSNLLYVESDYATIVAARQSSMVGGSPYLYAIQDTTPSGSTPAVRHIELFPTPVASTTGAMALVYRAIWANVTDDADYIPYPDYVKTLFIRILRAHASGFVRGEQGSLSLRLAELSSSPEFVAAVRQDRAMQTDIGEIVGSLPQYSIDRGRQIFSGVITGP